MMPQQAARYESDAWEDAIAEYFGTEHTQTTTILKVARNALSLETARLGTADQRRIAAALETLGWRRGERTNVGVTWHRPKVTQ
jgi:predicted P-loop ATPase